MEKFLKWTLLLPILFLALAFGGVNRGSILAIQTALYTIFSAFLVSACLKKDVIFNFSKDYLILIVLFLTSLLFLSLQLLPFPDTYLRVFSPRLFYLRDYLGMDSLVEFPAHLSVNGCLTSSSLLELLSYLCLVVAVPILFTKIADIRKIIIIFAVIGFSISIFGIIQKFNWNGKVYWIREIAQGAHPFGPFINRNHFAGFINMLIFPVLSLVFYRISTNRGSRLRSEREKSITVLLLFALLIMILALFLSLSRGGIVAFSSTLLFMLYLFRRDGLRLAKSLVIALMSLSVVLLLIMLGAAPLLKRLSTLIGLGEDASLLYRIEAWKHSLSIFMDFPLLGTGLGTFGEMFTFYRPESMPLRMVNAHNEFIQIMAETGFFGFALAIIVAVFFISKYRPKISLKEGRERSYFHSGLFCSLVALMIHNIVGFNLRIPANAYLFSLIAGLLLAIVPLHKKKKVSFKLILPLALLCLALLVFSTNRFLAYLSFYNSLAKTEQGAVKSLPDFKANDPYYNVAAGDYFSKIRNHKEASRRYSSAIKLAPLRGIVWAKKGISEEGLGDKISAIKDMEKAVLLDPVNLSYRFNLARLQLEVGQQSRSLDTLTVLLSNYKWFIPAVELIIKHDVDMDQFLGLLADDDKVIVKTANYLASIERFDDAENFFKRAISLAPEEISYLDRYASILIRLKKYDALLNMSSLFRAEPPHRAFYWMGEGSLRLGNQGEALGHFEKALNLSADNVPYMERLAGIYLRSKDYEKAYLMGTDLIAVSDKSYRGYSVLASVYNDRGNSLKAIENLLKASRLLPNNFSFHYRLALLYEKLGMNKNVIREFEECLAINPDNIQVRLKLGDAYVALGNKKRALDEYETAMILDPGNKAIINRLDKLN